MASLAQAPTPNPPPRLNPYWKVTGQVFIILVLLLLLAAAYGLLKQYSN